MHNKTKNLIIFIVVVVLSYFLAPYSGKLYEKIIGHQISGGWIGGCSECWIGFMLIFCFLIGLLGVVFFSKKRIKTILLLILIWPSLSLMAGDGYAFLGTLIFAIIGFVLGQLVYLIRKKLKLKNNKIHN